MVKTRKNLRVTNPAMLMRSFFGMVVSYFITEMVISNSVISNLMPKNSMDVYVDIFLHGIIKGVSMNSRLMSIIRKEFIQIFRDVRTLIMILIIPIMQLFLLGYSATNDVRNVPLAVLDQSRSPESRALLDAYRAADYFRIAYYCAI